MKLFIGHRRKLLKCDIINFLPHIGLHHTVRAATEERHIHRIADILETQGWELQPANQAGRYKALPTIYQEGIVHGKYRRITW
jgi:hypothetical protein